MEGITPPPISTGLAVQFSEAEMNYLRSAASDAKITVEDLVASYVREIIRDDLQAEAQ